MMTSSLGIFTNTPFVLVKVSRRQGLQNGFMVLHPLKTTSKKIKCTLRLYYTNDLDTADDYKTKTECNRTDYGIKTEPTRNEKKNGRKT